ncbi:hypothetical protein [Rhizobium leguminosarum]|uniref:hypothetical protein n=1 Tax=Rhizobium leguminosarum TaxID=384 RepID=UPI001AEB4162|nr:hypothetical protein [Rhizobium leguminosarum]MBP2447843.1 hypothetical protein [Rhizobium leguminosarum]
MPEDRPHGEVETFLSPLPIACSLISRLGAPAEEAEGPEDMLIAAVAQVLADYRSACGTPS